MMIRKNGGLGLLLGCEIEAQEYNTNKLTLRTCKVGKSWLIPLKLIKKINIFKLYILISQPSLVYNHTGIPLSDPKHC